MSIELNKKTGINLSKGSSISLIKEEKKLEEICIGINWGAIQKKFLISFFNETETVDLDGSVSMFDGQGNMIDTVYYRKLLSKDQSIKHSGDDRKGDLDRVDDFDNEVIQVNLKRVSPEVEQIFFYINSFKGQDFATIPYSKIRIFEGTPSQVVSVFATFNLSAEPTFAGKVSMIMGKLIREGNGWKFSTIGEAVGARNIDETIKTIQSKYL
ncbi:MAG: tellurium resistance TerZ family protein [Thermoflexibacter sp.]|jgi:tellurium resistance protein TerZ|nr:tellurium resistance TerZ family protein [Thermoflexibacter sp.]